MNLPKRSRNFGAAPERWPFFYGWFILPLGALGVLMSLPGQTVGVSVFIDPLIEALDTSRNAVSFTYMIGTLGAASMLPVMGKLFDRRGATFMATLSGAALGACIGYMAGIDVVTAAVNRVLSLFGGSFGVIISLSLGFFFIRLWGQGVITMVSRNMVMKWFDRRRGLVNGILGFITTIGFSLSPPVFDTLIRLFDWRGAYIILAVVVGGIFPIIALLFFRDNPKRHGLVPDGKKYTDHRKKTEPPSAALSKTNYTLSEARSTALFKFVVATLFISSVIETAVTFHIVSIFQESGLSRAAAVRFFFPVYLISIAAHFIGSWISDYIENKYFAVIQMLGVGLSCAMLLILVPGVPVWLLIFGQGLGHGMHGICSIVLWPRYFGTKHLGAIYGFAMVGGVVGSALGPFLFSLSLEYWGSYAAAGFIGLVLSIILIILMVRSFYRSDRLQRAD